MNEEFNRFLARLAEDLEYIQIGFQEFSSSELYISDPMDQARLPISEPIVPGRYPLFVSRKNWAHNSRVDPSPYNARFEVWFSDAEPTQWEQLINEDHHAYNNEFSAEFGSMAFLDKPLMDCLTPINKENELFEKYLSRQAYNDHTPLPYAEVKLDGRHRFFVVESGRGNGTYCAFAGRDDSGTLLRISVDFEL
jgi:hypothetical protein